MFRRTCQIVLVALVMTAMGGTTSTSSTQKAGENAMAGNYGEVRLRKLHLVRPDLIPYPIAYDVYC